ncbi:MAG: hypothetical protein LAP85_09625 [Acidobacteriia bacterium]|nr:hypothetical protein [Terriglobia bacterium]
MKTKLSKSAPPTPQKPAAPEPPAESKGRPYVSAFFPPARKKMLDELLRILGKAMPNKRASEAEPIITKFMEAFNRHMEEATGIFALDDVGINITALDEIVHLYHCLDGLLDMLDQLPQDSAENSLADILRPAVHWFWCVVSSDFPDLKLIRERLVAAGYGPHIQG